MLRCVRILRRRILVRTCRMSEGRRVLLLPIGADGFLAHDVHVSAIHRDLDAGAEGLATMVPLVVEGERAAETEGDHFAALRVPMEADAALGRVVVVIAFALQVSGLRAEPGGEGVVDLVEGGNGGPRDDTTSTFIVSGFLRFIVKAEIPTGLFVNHTAIHVRMFVHGEVALFLKEGGVFCEEGGEAEDDGVAEYVSVLFLVGLFRIALAERRLVQVVPFHGVALGRQAPVDFFHVLELEAVALRHALAELFHPYMVLGLIAKGDGVDGRVFGHGLCLMGCDGFGVAGAIDFLYWQSL